MIETPRLKPEPLGLERSVVIAVLLALGVCALLFWQHSDQREALQVTARNLEDIRRSRIDLAKGFLHLSLAEHPGSPFGEDSGAALLRQSIASFQRSLEPAASVGAPELERFRRSAGEFERLLGIWTRDRDQGSQTDLSQTLLALHIAYGDLERQAEQADEAARLLLERIAARTDRNFALTLGGCAGALLLTIGILILAARRQRLSLALRERTTRALSESEARRLEQAAQYRTVIETAMDGFCTLDMKGRILAVNETYVRRSGYSREELAGLRIADIEARESPSEVAARMRRIAHDGGALFEALHRRKDGTLWPVEVSASMSTIAGGRVYSFIRDISERKRAEQTSRERQAEELEEQHQARLAALNLMEDALAARARAETAIASLRESEQRLRMAQEGAHVGIWEWELASNRIYWSPECYRLHGIPPGSARMNEDWRARVLPEHPSRLDAEHRPDLTPGVTFEVEYQVQLDSGEIRWLVSKGGIQCDASGQPARLSGINMDVTERKRLVEELARYRLHLEDLVAVRTAELAASRNEAERLARAKSEFLANMSHEIRTPLNAVLGLARIGARDSGGRGVQGTFARILEAGEHLLGVINDILDYSKIEAGRFSLESRPFQTLEVIEMACDIERLAACEKGLDFRIEDTQERPDWVLGDAHRLRQILVNLLSNAVKFTERGEVVLQVGQAGSHTLFQVTDTGIGMTAEQISRLFRPFEQADGSTTRRFGGTGLGLAISHDLARLMGGGIQVESVPGQGSRFTLSLPLAETTAPLDEPASAPESSCGRLSGLRLLAAEDVEVNRLILEDLLEHEGARVVLTDNGRLALERLQADGPSGFDLVLMDVQMPEMDGYEATRRIRALAPTLPVLGLTAHALPEERAKCRAAGMLDLVTKPIDPETLVAAIRRHARGDRTAADSPNPAPSEDDPDPIPHAPPGLIDWEGLGQRYAGREAFLDKLIRIALEANAGIPGQLRAAIRERDLARLAFVAHSIKGAAGNLLAQPLAELARETEVAAKSKQARALELAEDLAAMVQNLSTELADH
ncbi:ATP-binding protein [Thiocystis violacea]|uniref:ATP-binding protein n=1 Tax=Thiocystis violacea TaxID=13725 RepID=UPI001903BAD3|nr:ATP-binding protein [Thiocystis violacea]